MRRFSYALIAAAAAVVAFPVDSSAQTRPGQESGQGEARRQDDGWNVPRLRLNQRANAGPCPFVKILYDAARYVEMPFEQPGTNNVGYTGEIQGVTANCSYRDNDPITVNMNILFELGRGPQATNDNRTYRYWIAVTDRNTAVLNKEYFDLPVNFRGQQRATVEEEIRGVVIPRAEITTSGSNFEILIGFEVTPEMAEFNRTGSRFRINAGTASAQQ
ncbi:MAG: Tat pathway signal sequence domain protein [Brevundimonas sp.]|uniref:Tat pathway signal sequence domain protein n=1 Tax=Brevundimonas sp. TaxID=1871086 RepID=UPI00391C8DC6